MSARGVFVTGTDTGVGKTVVACALVRGLLAHGARVSVMKPIASGSQRTAEGLRNEDALALREACGTDAPYAVTNPYCFEPPISPHLAAKEASIEIDTGKIAEAYRQLTAKSDFVVVEGAGGWLAPISDGQTMADLAAALGLPVVLVVGVKLGCLNHAQLSQRAIAAGGQFAGWVSSAVDPYMSRREENLSALERLLGEAALAHVPYLATTSAPLALVAAARRLLQG